MPAHSGMRSVLAAVLGLLAGACSDRIPTADHQLRRLPALARVVGESDNHIILTAGPASAALAGEIAARGGTIEANYHAIGVLAVSGLSSDAAAALAGHGDVKGIERDQIVAWLPGADGLEASDAGDDAPAATGDQSGATFYARQWNMRQIEADKAWLSTDQGNGALVCVLDTGIDPTHQDLAGKVDLAKSRSFVPFEPTIDDLHWHGTFVAGLVSSNGRGMASVAPDASICGVKVLSRFGSGAWEWIIAGVMHATDVRADVINMSLGGYFYSKSPGAVVLIEALQRAMEYASNNGTLVVASSGNQGLDLDHDTPDFIHVPSQLQKVVSVGATGPFQQQNFDQRAGYSNFGASGVDMTAPGGNRPPGSFVNDGILSACASTSLVFSICRTSKGFYLIGGTGTSFAAPHVAGAAAVFATNTRATGGDNTDLVKRYDARFLEGCLEKGLQTFNFPDWDKVHGKGRLNVERTMLCGSSPK